MLNFNVTLEGKTVLVTGAAGFIGANLVKRLLSSVKDIKIVGVDSVNDYYDVRIKDSRLQEIEALGKDWIFIKGNIADKALMEFSKVFSIKALSAILPFIKIQSFAKASICLLYTSPSPRD